jgi:4-amino-4-deoxy-L-arabinose transferase-like glycosyltransferase
MKKLSIITRPWNFGVAGSMILSLCFALTFIKWLEPLEANVESARHNETYFRGIAGRALIGDEVHYLPIALSVANGAGFQLEPGKPTAVRVPGYPLYVAALFNMFGRSVNVALVGNALLIALLPFLTFLLAEPTFGRKTAALAAFLTALNPGLYYFGVGAALSEPLFAVLICGATATWLRSRRTTEPAFSISEIKYKSVAVANSSPRAIGCSRLPKASLAFALGAGMLYGIASLTRTGYAGLPLVVVFLGIISREHKWFLKEGIALCLASGMILCLWVARNQAQIGSALVSSTNDGVTLLCTALAAERHRGDCINPSDAGPEFARVHELPDSVETNTLLRAMAISQLKKIPPSTLVEVVTKRIFRLWVPLNRIVSDQVSAKPNLAINAFYLPLVLLGVFGTWKARRSAFVVVTLALCSYMTLLAAASWGGTRFRYAAEPFVAVLAAYGLMELVRLHSLSSRHLKNETSGTPKLWNLRFLNCSTRVRRNALSVTIPSVNP